MILIIWSNLGAPKEVSKSEYIGRFLVNHTKSNFYKEILFKANLCSHKKMLFFQICSHGCMRAKRVSHASESSAVYENPANKNGLSEQSEFFE